MEMPSFLQSKQEIQLNNSRGQYFKNKKNLSIISLVVLLLAIPLTIWLLQTSKIFAPKASGGPIKLVSDPNSCVVSVDPAKVTCGTFPIKLTSPLGPNAEPGTSSAVLKKDITTPLSRILANSKSLIDGLGKGFVIESVSAQATDAILAANPNPCNIASGQETCSSTITWNAGNKTNVRITIRENPGSLFATGASGTQVAPWIRSTGATFDLYSGDTLLKSLVVTGNPSSSTASPAPSTSTSTPSVAPTVSTLTNGLIAYWNLNETSGDIANDYTGANNAAILNTRTALGKFGQARNFAAPWDYIQVTSPKNFLRSGVTASAWVNTVGSSKKQYITWQGSSWSLFLSSSGIPTFSIAKADGGYIVCDGTTPISNNSWHLITGSFDGGNLKVYSDGVLQNTCAFSNTLRGYENSFWIGYGGSSQEPFIGNIDEVAIWNRALTQTEVTGMANGALPGQSSGGSGGTGSALITASPAICNIPTGGETCSSTISWNAGSATNVKISIRENPGSLFATGATGTQVAPWIRTSGATFDLYSGNSLISSVFVKGVDGSGSPAPTSGLGLITAAPNPCNITSGNEMCSSTISWNAGSRTDVKISIRENPGSVFATGASGTQVAPWIRSTGATFDLYSGNVLVDSLFVKGVDPNASPSPRASGVGTVKYRIAESEAGLQNAEFKPYNQDPLFIDFTFSDVNPGSKQIWAEFIGLDGSSKKEHIFVELAEPDPVVTSLDCSMDISKQNLKLTLNGSRFGTGSGKVTANAKEAQVLTWQNDQVSATVAPEGSLDDGKLFKVVLTRSDGKALPEINCQVNTTLISLGARLFCREPGKFDVNGVKATLVDEAGNKVNEEVTIDKDGIINGLKTKLQVGKRYAISVKAPFSLRRNALFTAANGTNIVTPEDGSSFVLPIGDIAPVVLNDGKINTLDHAEIVRQWAVFGNTIKTADFNKDTKVNSIDWACMRYDFNKEDDAIPTNAALPSPSPTVPGSSVTPTQSASPSASASVTTSPSPVASGQRSAYFLIEPFGGGSYKNDDEFIVNINLWSQNEAANLFSLKLSFDPSILEVSRIEKGTALTTWAEDNFDNQTGKISLTAGLPNPGLKTVEGADPLMAKIIFKGKKVGTTTLSVSSDSKIYSNSDNQNILTSLLSSQIAITN